MSYQFGLFGKIAPVRSEGGHGLLRIRTGRQQAGDTLASGFPPQICVQFATGFTQFPERAQGDPGLAGNCNSTSSAALNELGLAL